MDIHPEPINNELNEKYIGMDLSHYFTSKSTSLASFKVEVSFCILILSFKTFSIQKYCHHRSHNTAATIYVEASLFFFFFYECKLSAVLK